MKTLKSINSTYLFRLYDEQLNLSKTVLQLVTDSLVLGDNELGEYIATFDRRYMFPLKNKVVDDYKTGRVKVIFNNKNYRLPNTIPFFLINTGNSVNCIVNITNFTRLTAKTGVYNIEPKILFSLMQGGTILATCYQKFNTLKNKTNIIKIGSYMYARLFTKVMNKMFSLNITPAKTDMITFLSSMFFISNLLGRDEETMEDLNIKYSRDNCSMASKLVIDDIVDKFDFQEDLKDLNTFITAIAKNIAGLEDLNTRAFTEQYVVSYGANMLLGLEFLPIFIHNLGCVMVGSYLNNQHAMENMLGKDIDKFISEFVTL